MANLLLKEAQVLPDGRVLRTRFEVWPEPVSHGVPDWMPGYVVGHRLTLNGGSECDFLGALSVEWTMAPPGLDTRANASSTIAPGKYFYRVAFADAGGVEREISGLAGEFGSPPELGLPVLVGEEVVLRFERPVPVGMTGRVYLSNVGEGVESMRLHATDLPAGTSSYTSTSNTFVDASKSPDRLQSWIVYWLIPETGIVVYQQAGVLISGPAGLIQDSLGNVTDSFSNYLVQNRSTVEADGWTTSRFTRTPNGQELYVSSTHGNDANPGTLGAPLASVNAAISKLPNKSGSAVRLLRGDRFVSSARLSSRAGPDGIPESPMILEDYWHDYVGGQLDPGVRPILDFTTNPKNEMFVIHGGFTTSCENLVCRRLHIIEGDVSVNTGGTNLIFSDCIFENSTLAANGSTPYRIRASMFHRCIVFDNRKSTFGGRVQGSHAHDTDQLLISQCMYDRNGYPAPDFSIRDVFSHNIYLQTDVHESIVWGSWLMRGGSHGIQVRGGGVIAYNVFSRNAIGGQISNKGRYIRRNVYLSSEDLTVGQRGFGPSADPGFVQAPIGAVIEFNVVAHHNSGSPKGISANNERDVADFRYPRKYDIIRHNLVYNHGRCLTMGGSRTTGGSEVRRNVFIANSTISSNQHIYYLPLSTLGSSDLSWLEADQNVVWSVTNGTEVYFSEANPGSMTFAAWQNQFGQDTQSIEWPGDSPPALMSSQYDLGDYAADHGAGIVEADLVAALRTRPPGTWSALHDAKSAAATFALAYQPLALPPIDGGQFGFYGPTDYRSQAFVTYEITSPVEPTRGQRDLPIEFTIEPSTISNDTLTASDGDSGGFFSPNVLIWNGDDTPKTIRYTPRSSGYITIVLERDLMTVASRAIHIRRRFTPGLPRMRGGISINSSSL